MCLHELNVNVSVMGWAMEPFWGTSETGLRSQMTALLEDAIPCFSRVTLCPGTSLTHHCTLGSAPHITSCMGCLLQEESGCLRGV